MKLPFGEIIENRLVINFNSADYSVATVMNAVKERIDLFGEMQVAFMGVCTEIPTGPTPVFRSVPINAHFTYNGPGDVRAVLERIYVIVWESIATSFPDEGTWAKSKSDFGDFISAQADLLRARIDSNRT